MDKSVIDVMHKLISGQLNAINKELNTMKKYPLEVMPGRIIAIKEGITLFGITGKGLSPFEADCMAHYIAKDLDMNKFNAFVEERRQQIDEAIPSIHS